MQQNFTERYLNSIAPAVGKDRWETDSRYASQGYRLMLRICTSGSRIWYLRLRHGGADERHPLGLYLRPGDPGHMSLDAARRAAHAAANVARTTNITLAAASAAMKVSVPVTVSPAAATIPTVGVAMSASVEKTAASSDCRLTVADVAEQYAKFLDAQGGPKKKSAGQVRSAFKLGIAEPFAHIASMNAAELTPEHATDVIRKGMALGRSKNAADKLRSVMQSAYTVAMGASTNPNVPDAGKPSGIRSNPFSSMIAVKGAKQARMRVLSEYELCAVMRALKNMEPVVTVVAIELLIRCAGQRSAQLLRLKCSEVAPDLSNAILWDPKGNRPQPRLHTVPTVPRTVELLTRQLEVAKILKSEYVFTTSGHTMLNPQTVTYAFREIANAIQANDPAVGYFMLKDVRTTAETWLSSKRISKDTRGHLQSHGLTGVQHTHYDMHDYFDEKEEALLRWNDHLDALIEHGPAVIAPDAGMDPRKRYMPETMSVDRELFESLVLPHLVAR